MGGKHDGDVAFIRALAEILRETDLTEIEVKRSHGEADRMDVRVARQAAIAVHAPPPAAVPAPALPVPAAAPASPSPEDPARHPGAITSPMVGTVYLQAEPGTPPFAKVGDTVAEGQTLLIIEAMKTMNQIPAPRAGTVRRILVDDGAPVEFGSPLMILE
jgi:acetyl-CoA carboxylase biotin carboxyl carrier protein